MVNRLKLFRQATRERAESLVNYRAIFELSGAGHALADPRTKRLYQVNRKLCEMTGYSAEELIGMALSQMTHPEDIERDLSEFDKLMRGEINEYSIEKRYICKGGSIIWVHATTTIVRDPQGNPTATIAVIQDITERQQAVEASRRMAAIVQWSADAIISKDLHGIITTWNKGAEGLFGYTAREVLGKPITLLMPSDRWHEEPVILEHIRRGEPIIDFETVRRRKDGSLVDISLCVSPVKDADGNIIGASKIARDITKRKRMEHALKAAHEELHRHAQELEQTVATRTAELRQTVAELEAFSYSLSHDLRAPLRTIHSFVELVLQQHGQQIGAEGTEFLRTSINSARRLDRLIQSLLAFTKLSKQPPNFQTVDVEQLVRETISAQIELQAPRAEVTIQSPLLPVRGDEVSLIQCLTNLLGNGVKYVAPGVQPRLRIYSERRGEFVRLWIEDNGIGIAPADQEHLFEMFRRGDVSQQYEGSGLGLAIVRKAVERMGGQVGVESEPGRGSRFWLELKAGS